MATKVSVSTSSAANSASRTGETSAARSSASSADAAGGFSSAMSAATRPKPTENDSQAGGGSSASPTAASTASPAAKAGTSANTATNANTATSANTATGANTTTGAKANTHAKTSANSDGGSAAITSTTDADNLNPDVSAAAPVHSDALTLDADWGTQNAKPGKPGDKSRAESTDASATSPGDAAALALMLARSGMQLDGRYVPGQQTSSDESKHASSTTDGGTAQAIAAGALAANVAAGSFVGFTDGVRPVAATPGGAATAVASASTSTSTSDAGSAARSDVATLFALESDSSSGTSSDAAAAGSGSTQAKSGTDDGALADKSAGSNALPDIMVGMTSGPAAQFSVVERSISTPVSDRNWSSAVAGQIHWMVNSNVQNATLKLSPEHLGPLEVHIDVQSSQVNVTFSASHADTRAALEQSVASLRGILAAGGLTLGQTSVQQEAGSGSRFQPSVSRAAVSASQSVDAVSVSSVRALGLIDEYA